MEEIQEVNRTGQIDQLNSLRFKMQSGKFNLSRSSSEEILENEMPVARKGIPKEETFNKYGGADGKVGIDAIGKHGTVRGDAFLGHSGGGSLIEGRFVYTVGNNPISAVRKKPAPMLVKIENSMPDFA